MKKYNFSLNICVFRASAECEKKISLLTLMHFMCSVTPTIIAVESHGTLIQKEQLS